MIFDHALVAVGLEEEARDDFGSGFGGSESVEGRRGATRKIFLRIAILRRTRRNSFQQRFWKREDAGTQRIEHGFNRGALLRCGDDFGIFLHAAANVEGIIESANALGDGSDLIAMVEVNRNEDILESGHRSAFRDGGFGEAFERGGADRHDLLQAVDVGAADVPKMRDGTGGAERASFSVRKIELAARKGAVENFIERLLLVRTLREILIAVINRDSVPCADADGVGV